MVWEKLNVPPLSKILLMRMSPLPETDVGIIPLLTVAICTEHTNDVLQNIKLK
jgi:hypothetical protein